MDALLEVEQALQTSASSDAASSSGSALPGVASSPMALMRKASQTNVGGGQADADSIAERHQMWNMGRVLPGSNYYLFKTKDHTIYKRSFNRLSLDMDPGVGWAEVQEHKLRVKRDKGDDGYLKEQEVADKSTERQVRI